MLVVIVGRRLFVMQNQILKKLIMKNLSKALMLLFITTFAISCSSDDDNTTTPPDSTDFTIFANLSNDADYTSLIAALERAGLRGALDGEGALTLFAPTNTAFEAFLTANGFAVLEDVPVDVLTQVLLNHVVGGTNLSTDLSTGYVNSLATFGDSENNLSMFINTADGVLINGESNVTLADTEASNGVIHKVDDVIDLPTVVTFAVADATFSNLVAALTRDDQPDYVSVLTTPNGTTPAPFTVFAPTDQAFADLLAELGVDGLEDIDGATLTATLNSHVVPEANVRAEDLTDGTVPTLGAELTIDASNATITDPNGRVSNIIVTNVQAANGVVHAIDKVILPQL